MIVKHGHKSVSVDLQEECVSVVLREYNPYSDTAKTVAFLVSEKSFVSMLAVLAEVVDDERQANS